MGWFRRMPSTEDAAQAAANLDAARQDAERASKERDAAFWEDYERRNGEGSVDWTGRPTP